ncbi:hypothetical protein [Paraburkholderia sacchari]|uniref:hypothetical protein n=1 Tax=Paraburkholderia sacchari TaxID=159450 RepID=UPI00054432BB|nr:hypothetical protein [Paraburkholderia sacchari]NLP60700.1 hypothetical protein [Paraburkholderia sacchari]
MVRGRRTSVTARQTSETLVSLVSTHLEDSFGVYDLILTEALDSIRDPRAAHEELYAAKQAGRNQVKAKVSASSANSANSAATDRR